MGDKKFSQRSVGYSSPACLAHEMDGGYAGYLTPDELIQLFNTLLDIEWIGERSARALAAASPSPEVRRFLEEVARESGRFASAFSRHIEDLGGERQTLTTLFQGAAGADGGFSERLALLSEGQSDIVRMLKKALPRIQDDRLHAAVKERLGAHEANHPLYAAIIEAMPHH